MARTRSMRQQAWEKSGGNCCLCGLPMLLINTNNQANPLAYTLEHILPKSRGGTNDLDNLDGSHQWCNNFKNGNTVDELPPGWKKFLRWKIKHLIANQKISK